MSLTAEQFGKALIAAGLWSADEINAFWDSLPADQRPKDGDTFAGVLIQREKLTEFQADELLSGGTTPLVFGDYVLLAKIGAGGMGQVFKARHRHMKRPAAIKLLPPAMTKDEAAVKRFQREVEAAAKLSHPNIVQTYDAGVQRGVWYLVMEYVEGRDLSGVIAAEGPLSIARAVDCIRQTARGLAYAHENGVVHRDIKPANLLLDKKGTVKILDMGLARFDEPNQEGLTESGQVMGTVDYMAPEQAFDVHKADGRADIYSLGCTLYRLLTNRNVYEAESLVQKLMAHQNKPVPALATHRPDVPQALVAIFERMVAKTPEDRYQSMTEVEASLANCTQSIAASSTPKLEADSKLTSFFRSITGAKAVTPAAIPPATISLAKSAIALDAPEVLPTVNLSNPLQATDPVSDRSIQVARENTTPPFVARQKPWWQNRIALTVAGVASVLLIALGAWGIIGNSDPRETARVPVPVGGSAGLVEATETTSVDQTSMGFALNFDGQNDYVAIPTLKYDGSHPLTIDAIVTCQSIAKGSCGVICANNFDHLGLFAHREANRWAVEHSHYGKYQSVGMPEKGLELGRQVQLSVVLAENQLAMFVNGEKAVYFHSKDLHLPTDPKGMFIGCLRFFEGQPQQCFDGIIHEVRVSKTARNSTDRILIDRRLTAGNDTLALYHFNEGQGDVLVDSAGNNHHGKIVGAKWVHADGSPITAAPVTTAPPLAKAPFTAAEAKAHQQAWAKHLGVKVETTNSVGIRMALIPPGEFMMGSSDEDVALALKIAEETKLGADGVQLIQEERPQHLVRIAKPFRLGIHEVTIGQFGKFIEQSGYKTQAEEFGGNSDATKADDPRVPPESKKINWRTSGQEVGENSPVTQVSWNDAVVFCNWLSEQEKLTPSYAPDGNSWALRPQLQGYRLPTEAEWEYACRAGTTTQYSFGDDWKEHDKFGWSNGNAGGRLRAVGLLDANPFGLYDMHGNVWEWCHDWYDGKWYARSPSDDPRGPHGASNRVFRGGGWHYTPALSRSSYRHYNRHDLAHRSYDRGFRLVLPGDAVQASGKSQSAIPSTRMPTSWYGAWQAREQNTRLLGRILHCHNPIAAEK